MDAAARAGVHLIQVRERDLDGGPLLRLVQRCVAATRGTRARVLVNERFDVALSAGAAGVHLRSDSMSARRVRSMAPAGFVIGRSVHDVEAACRAADDGVDYVLFGTVFESASKPGRAPAGPDAVARAAAATSLPVLAVGGITVPRASTLKQAGAAGVAAIGLFVEPAITAIPALVRSLELAFDTPDHEPDNKQADEH